MEAKEMEKSEGEDTPAICQDAKINRNKKMTELAGMLVEDGSEKL